MGCLQPQTMTTKERIERLRRSDPRDQITTAHTKDLYAVLALIKAWEEEWHSLRDDYGDLTWSAINALSLLDKDMT